MIDNCKHERFMTESKVTRLTDVEGGEVTGYSIDIQVHCSDCMKPFQFIGLPMGMSPTYPTTCPEGVEARMPIKPVC